MYVCVYVWASECRDSSTHPDISLTVVAPKINVARKMRATNVFIISDQARLSDAVLLRPLVRGAMTIPKKKCQK